MFELQLRKFANKEWSAWGTFWYSENSKDAGDYLRDVVETAARYFAPGCVEYRLVYVTSENQNS